MLGVGGVELTTSSGVLIRERARGKQAELPCTLAASPCPQLARRRLMLAGCFLLLLPHHPTLPDPTLTRSLTERIPKKSARVPAGAARAEPAPHCLPATLLPRYRGASEGTGASQAPLFHLKQHPRLQNTPRLSPSPRSRTSHLGGKDVIYIRRDPQTLPPPAIPAPQYSLSMNRPKQ